MGIGGYARTMAMLLCMAVLIQASVDPSPPANDPLQPERELFGRINAERMMEGSPALAWSDTLCSVASSYAREIAQTGFVSHVSLDGKTPWDRVMASHYYDNYFGMAYVSEIIEVHEGSVDPDFTISGIMGSPEHRGTLLSTKVTEAGIGFASFSNLEGQDMRPSIVCVLIFAYHYGII